MTNHDFKIEGMTCGSCAARVTESLEKIPGARDVSVNFALRTGHVAGDLSHDEITRAVKAAGYNVIFGESPGKSPDILADTSSQWWQSEEDKVAYGNLKLSILLSMPVVIIAMSPLGRLAWSGGIQAVLTTALLLGPGRGFFVRALQLARSGRLNMDSLVAIGIGSAYVYSIWQMSHPGVQHLYFESAVMIATFVLAGRWLEERARNSAIDAIAKLASLRPRVATVRKQHEDGTHHDEEVSVDLVRPGDHVVVAAGQGIPADGRVLFGRSDVDESLVSGEQLPTVKTAGDQVVGGAVNLGPGELVILTEKIGADTFLAKVMDLVRGAQASRPAIQKLVDIISSRFVPAVVLIAGITFLIWLPEGFEIALKSALAVLVIACPCALGLATPTAILAGTGRAARSGILIRDPDALQKIHNADRLVVDKTGTVTSSNLTISEHWLDPSFSKSDLVFAGELFCLAQARSRHPVAKSIKNWIESGGFGFVFNNGNSQNISQGDIQEIAGRGIVARFVVDGRAREVTIGNADHLKQKQISFPSNIVEQNDSSSVVSSIVWMALDGKVVARLSLSAEIRDASSAAVQMLDHIGIKTVMASGDAPEVVKHVAEGIGIGEHYGAMLPRQKLELVKKLQNMGHRVIMAGDGINDAPALSQADVGIAVGGGSDVAIGSAGLVIPSGQLDRIASAISLSRAIVKIIRQNLFWAFFYNAVAIPFAATGRLSPMVAAAAMALSSVSVVTNSLRLNRMTIGDRYET